MKQTLLFFTLAIIFSSCLGDQLNVPDTKGIDGSFELFRMEQEIMRLDTNEIEVSLAKLERQYPAFMGIYLQNVMGFINPEEPSLAAANIKGFIGDENINLLYQATQIHYGDFDDLAADFESAFKLYKYYFPQRDVPDIYTFFSEYGIQRFLFSDENGKDALGIGLDLFLGADYPYQEFIPNNPAFSSYLIRRFNREHLVKRGVGALVEDILGANRGKNMLEQMIHNGKKLYLLDHLLPYTQDSIIIEYTEDQLNWCEENQIQIWAYFLKEDLFYETDNNKINKLVNPAPNHPNMPPEAPGRTGNYIGWKIVEAFMQRQPDMSLSDLIAFEDEQKILEISKYKPRK